MILHGDSLMRLKGLEAGSVDAIVTDPPYGYSFMGKDWDKAVPSVEIWKECLRVLKPGAFCLVMSAPRSDVQMHMIRNLEQAGFRIDFTPIYWTYASGFPKAGNIGKLVDKRLGAEREAKPLVRVDGKLQNNKDGGGWAQNSDKYLHHPDAITDQAKALDGSYAGFQPKPAVEVIIVAMKPLSEKTYVDQALKNGKGISWLDDCRIPTGDTLKINSNGKRSMYGGNSLIESKTYTEGGFVGKGQDQGRFPANLLVSDDVLNGYNKKENNPNYKGGKYINCVVTKSNKSDYNWTPSDNQETATKVLQSTIKSGVHHGDSGSYSRYFDLDKWAENQKAPRVEEQTGHISRYSEDIIPQTLPFLIVPKASKSEKNKGLEDREAVNNKNNMQTRAEREGRGHRSEVVSKNNHPTVKPLKLMSYLITLFSRPGDTVLDPFCGSGTTCIAAKMLKREYIGIEREAEYVEIAEARLKAHEPELTLL